MVKKLGIIGLSMILLINKEVLAQTGGSFQTGYLTSQQTQNNNAQTQGSGNAYGYGLSGTNNPHKGLCRSDQDCGSTQVCVNGSCVCNIGKCQSVSGLSHDCSTGTCKCNSDLCPVTQICSASSDKCECDPAACKLLGPSLDCSTGICQCNSSLCSVLQKCGSDGCQCDVNKCQPYVSAGLCSITTYNINGIETSYCYLNRKC